MRIAGLNSLKCLDEGGRHFNGDSIIYPIFALTFAKRY